MPRNVLLRTLESGRAALSPWSVWEILSHLDEGEFARQRGYLARLLAAPLLERDAHQRLRWRFRIDRRTDTDADLLRRLLANLHDSRTLAEFHQKPLIDIRGRTRLVSDVAARARGALAQQENRYVEMVQKCIDRLRSAYVNIDDEERLEANGLVEGHAIQLKRGGARGRGFGRVVRNESYFFWATVLEHAVLYLRRPSAILDPNDFEDAVSCGHIRLGDSWVVIVQDATMRTIIQRISDRLTRFYPHRRGRITALEWAQLAHST